MAPEKHTVDFGARLREARERRGVSLRVIADATKISVRVLQALEDNDISRLPGGIFSRGFVRAYALEVGLDPEETIAEFITRFPVETVTQGHPRTRALVDELDADSRRTNWPIIARVALVGVPALALLAYVGLSGRRISAVPVQSVSAETPQSSQARATATLSHAGPAMSLTVHALRVTSFSVAPDGLAAADFTLDAGASRTVEANRELLLVPTDASALEWSINGSPARRMTGSLVLTPGTLQGVLAAR